MRVLSRRTCLDRTAVIDRYRTNRRRSDRLFALVRDAMYDQPLELRHPFIFYLGHIPAFHFNTLAKRALGLPAFNEQFDTLFRRGIDPETVAGARDAQSLWPSVDEVRAYTARVDTEIESILSGATLDDPQNPYLAQAQAVYTILEHEEMHQETLMYIINRLDDSRKTTDGMRPEKSLGREHRSKRMIIPGGRVTIGARCSEIPFGWDNEFGTKSVDVASFLLESLPITNGQYLAFVKQGAAPPANWAATEAGWMQRTMYGLARLQTSWPAYVSLEAAEAYAQAAGGRIMTEPEFHRAAFGDPNGMERIMPWGNEPARADYGNFGFRRFDPEPVGSSPLGASAWGIHELVGNGWEWTSTSFGPLPGFRAMASYPEYSADFFDGKHAVLKGASPVTSTTLLRPSLRNWFRRDYPYAFTKFRLAYSV